MSDPTKLSFKDGDPEKYVYEDYMSMWEDGFELLESVDSNVASFIRYSKKKKDEIIAKLEKIRATPTNGKKGAVILDPLGKLFSIIKIEPLDNEAEYPITFMVRMEPPYIPHFFLTVSYIFLSKRLIPSVTIRTQPLVSLVSLVTRGNRLTSAVAWVASNAVLFEKFLKDEVVTVPYIPSLLDLPVETGTIYLTSLGYATDRSNELELSVKLDLDELPTMPENVISKLGFRPYRSVLDEVLEEVIP